MKRGAVALDTTVSDACAWNAIKYRDRLAVVTVARNKLAGSPDRFQLLRPWLLSSVSLAVVATTAAVDAGLSPALALNECGPLVLDSASCAPAGNPYPTGIGYDTNNGLGGTPINLTLLPGVIVTIPAGAGGVNAVNAANSTGVTPGSANISITADGVTINNTANPLTANNTGLRIQSSGDAIITATNTTINVAGTASEDAIVAFAMPNAAGIPHLASVTWSGGSLTSSGTEATGIQADNRGIGNATIAASGNITGTPGVGGAGFYGLIAHAGDSFPSGVSGAGDASVTFNSGTISVFGRKPRGIVVWAEGDGSAVVTTGPGTVINVSGSNNPGVDPPTLPLSAAIAVQLDSATAANGRSITANVASTITSSGATIPDPSFFSNPVGIRTISYVDAPTTVTYTGPGITTHGGGGAGIMALSGSGSITVNASGPINTTDGANAVGILADSGTILSQKSSLQTDTTTIRQGSALRTSTTGSVQVTASNVSTLGEFGTAISATGGSGGVTVNIPSGGSIMGGWQADATSLGSVHGLPAAGIVLGSSAGAATLTNDGTIGALSDRAVASSPLFPSNNTSIINNSDGTITGFAQLVGGNNSIINNGTFNLRHFADTDGDGVRDTLRVAVTDLGPGIFTNNGTLAMLGGPGATMLDATGQYLPLGLTFNSMALGGPVQGQILGATTFTNSGTIDLQANLVAGDVLMITGGRGGSAPGIGGGGTFISNGGTLKLDTVLNQGGPASQSDVLVVDGTSVGPGGATSMSIRNAGGTGALTVGDGILVVQVLDPSRSAPGVFALAGEVRGGAFDYDLFHGGLNGSNPQDWFLRSTFIVGPPIVVPPEPPILPPIPPPEVLPPGVFPIIGPELATYGVVQPIARQMGLTTLGTLHERVGDAAADAACLNAMPDNSLITKAPPVLYGNCRQVVWGRLFGQQIDNHYQAFADPRASGQVAGIQAGADLWRGSLIPGHSDSTGVYFAYGNGNVNVDGLVTNTAATAYVLQHTGSVNLNAYSVGGYWTHYGPGGWYIDAVLQGSFYNGNASTQFANLPISGAGFSSSLEAGYPIPLPWLGPRFVLEPEGQIIWQQVSFRDADDGLGPVGLGTTSGASGRLGLRGKWTINDPAGRVWQPYVLANVWQDWGGNATTMFGVDPVPLIDQATRLEFAGGLSAKILPGLSLYAQAGYQFATSSQLRRDGVKGNFGVHYAW
ncbi:autotransporter outer membrane beta-barrel domain-containing protein [Bradyrhizobium iriomotense]|uniref:Autotransporter domain-containing protein n=1 Tax=Bradyrhizobium iriomotense TaxID=441950 RepID=A0ABQ6AZS1_9BRAD|nr:autotransporter outer membrane beta-barrel domain-containing protein [Bradyrhizobium iriomotense]GLR85403.1 hypothetical protein GCM10007857_21140 [Bradyrhizobium iriomotense]